MINGKFEITTVEPIEKQTDSDMDGTTTYVAVMNASHLLPILRESYQSVIFSDTGHEVNTDPDAAVAIMSANIVLFKNGHVGIDIQQFAVNCDAPLGLLPEKYWKADELGIGVSLISIPVNTQDNNFDNIRC